MHLNAEYSRWTLKEMGEWAGQYNLKKRMITSTPEQNEKPTPPKILIMGAPGSYKTTLMLQFPDIHVLDCDKNLEGPKKFLRQGYKDESMRVHIPPPLPRLTFSYEPVRFDGKNPRNVEDCYDAVIDELKRMKPGNSKDYAGKQIIGLDSLSHVNEFIIRKIMKLKGGGSEMEFKTQWWTEFKSLAYSLLVSKLEETNLMVICLAHEIKLVEADKDKITKQNIMGYEPFFQGKVGDTIGAFFTDVWRMEMRPVPGGRTECVLQTMRTNLCDYLKNSFGMPKEILIHDGSSNYAGFAAIKPYLKNLTYA